MISAAQMPPKRAQVAKSLAMGIPEQKAGGIKIAGSGGIDHLGDRFGVLDDDLVAGHHEGAAGAAGQRGHLDVAAHMADGGREIGSDKAT